MHMHATVAYTHIGLHKQTHTKYTRAKTVTHTRTYVRTHMHIITYIHTCIYIYSHMNVCAYVHLSMHVHFCTCKGLHMYIRIH